MKNLPAVPVDVEHASEYGYRKPLNGGGSLVIAITQSGETADTTAALRLAKENGKKTLSISNVVDSTISHEADANFFTWAGKEVAIPATKSFTTQLTAMYMLALFLASHKGTLSREQVARRLLSLVAAAVDFCRANRAFRSARQVDRERTSTRMKSSFISAAACITQSRSKER